MVSAWRVKPNTFFCCSATKRFRVHWPTTRYHRHVPQWWKGDVHDGQPKVQIFTKGAARIACCRSLFVAASTRASTLSVWRYRCAPFRVAGEGAISPAEPGEIADFVEYQSPPCASSIRPPLRMGPCESTFFMAEEFALQQMLRIAPQLITWNGPRCVDCGDGWLAPPAPSCTALPTIKTGASLAAWRIVAKTAASVDPHRSCPHTTHGSAAVAGRDAPVQADRHRTPGE